MKKTCLFILLLLFCSLVVPCKPAPAADETERLYKTYSDAVYQVQVIDIASGKKTSIGSGFQFTKDGLIATNYHVVADALQRPARNRVEFLHGRGETGALKIVIADAVHDVAIVRMAHPGKTFLALGTSRLPKGTNLYSLGNPHDLGFTIVPGTFGGLSHDSFIDEMNFSGAINPGMSGGPVIGHDGRVSGINVATAGNDIGFLVPVERLEALYARAQKRAAKDDFAAHADAEIQKQLLAVQDKDIGALLANKKWESLPFGPFRVPGHIHDAIKCWGGTDDKQTDPVESHYSACATQDRIFLDTHFDTGAVMYRFNLIAPKKGMTLPRFYAFYQAQFGTPDADFNNAGEGDVTNFSCNTRFLSLAGARWKAAFCLRQYKKYPALFDMHLYMAMVGAGRQGFLVTLAAQGVSQKNALALTARFLHEIRPNGTRPHS